MRKSKFGALLASTAMGIPMSPVEQRMGRLMRAPDEHKDPIEAMMDDDGVEGQWGGEPAKGATDDKKEPAKKAAPKKEEPVDGGDENGDDDPDEQGEGDEDEGAEEGEEGDEKDEQKPRKKTAQERIQELNRQLREERRARADDRRERQEILDRLDRMEKGLPNGEAGGKKEERVEPDPTDLEKYPLGALDDRYVKDMIKFGVESGLEQIMDRTTQRQRDEDLAAENDRIVADLLEKADTMSDKGATLYDDFDEVVTEPAKAGKFALDQPTFEACAEAEHGAAILYDLAKDVKEAARVAALSPYQQLKYVADKNAEKLGKAKPKLPGAGDPPKDAPRGARGKFEVSDDTDDLEAFGKKFDKA